MVKRHGNGKIYWLDIWVKGKRVRRSLRTAEWSLAVARAQEVTARLRAEAKRENQTLKDIADQYLSWAREQKPASVHAEELRLPLMLGYLESIGVNRLEDLTTLHVEKLRGWLQEREDAKTKKKRRRSKTTINRYTQLLRGLIYRAIDWGLFAGPNPVKKVKFYHEEHDGTRTAYQPEEINRIQIAAEHVAATAGSPTQSLMPDIIGLALNTGLRRGELQSLKWDMIRGEEIHIRGKGDRSRAVPLNDSALAILSRRVRQGQYILPGIQGTSPSIFRRTFRRISKLSGVSFGLHRLRHTFATNLLAAGVDIVTVSSLLGHGSVMTSLLYTHTSMERKREAVGRLAADKGIDTHPGHRLVDVADISTGEK